MRSITAWSRMFINKTILIKIVALARLIALWSDAKPHQDGIFRAETHTGPDTNFSQATLLSSFNPPSCFLLTQVRVFHGLKTTYDGLPQSKFPTRPTAINLLLREETACTRRVTTHDACTRGASLVFILASLQRLKMEALILAPADCEVRCMIKFLHV